MPAACAKKPPFRPGVRESRLSPTRLRETRPTPWSMSLTRGCRRHRGRQPGHDRGQAVPDRFGAQPGGPSLPLPSAGGPYHLSWPGPVHLAQPGPPGPACLGPGPPGPARSSPVPRAGCSYDGPVPGGIYFRQLRAGLDFAVGDQFATTMRTMYVVGDAGSREVLLVDPAYDIASLLAWTAGQGLEVVGAVASHYHADHIGGEESSANASKGWRTSWRRWTSPCTCKRPRCPGCAR